MLLKKALIIVALVLTLILVITSCGGKTETPATTTVAPPVTTPSAQPTTTTAPAATTTVATTAAATTAPVVSTGGVTGISIIGASLEGSIAKGFTADRQGFDCGTSSGNYAFNWEEKGDFGAGSFTRQVDGLTGGTTYYYRAKAHNSFGWGYGEEKTFRTLGIPEITGVSANYGLQGNTLEVTITGIDFTGASAVSLGDGITVTKYTVSSDTKIIASISIAANTATGGRTITITTEIGTGTLADAFTVKAVRQVKHTTIWTSSKFDQIMHTLAPDPDATYELRFGESNQLVLTTTRPYTLWVEIQNGKLCITNITQDFWNDFFASGSQYLAYDSVSRVITFNALPADVLQTKFDVPLDTLPVFSDRNGVAGSLYLFYYLTEEVL